MQKPFAWIKLFTDILKDPRLGRQTDAIQMRYIQLQLIAGECDARGALIDRDYPLDEMDLAWRLRKPVDQLRDELQTLLDLGLLERNADPAAGESFWIVVNFALEQGRTKEDKRAEWRIRQRRRRTRLKSSREDEKTTASPGDAAAPDGENPAGHHHEPPASAAPGDQAHTPETADIEEICSADVTQVSHVTSVTRVTPVTPLEKEKEEEEEKEEEKEGEEEGKVEGVVQGEDVVAIYRRSISHPLNRRQRRQIKAVVTDCVLWDATIDHWLDHGWNPKNIRGLLELYQRGGPDGCRQCKPANNRSSGAKVASLDAWEEVWREIKNRPP